MPPTPPLFLPFCPHPNFWQIFHFSGKNCLSSPVTPHHFAAKIKFKVCAGGEKWEQKGVGRGENNSVKRHLEAASMYQTISPPFQINDRITDDMCNNLTHHPNFSKKIAKQKERDIV